VVEKASLTFFFIHTTSSNGEEFGPNSFVHTHVSQWGQCQSWHWTIQEDFTISECLHSHIVKTVSGIEADGNLVSTFTRSRMTGWASVMTGSGLESDERFTSHFMTLVLSRKRAA
jgi:hypothetical protein